MKLTDQELDELLNDPLLELTPEEITLFQLPEDMRSVMESKKRPDYVAQMRPCNDFSRFAPLFSQVHEELREGKRHLIRATKTASMDAGHFYVVGGQLLYLEQVGKRIRSANGLPDARTRCIYENGTESDILLQTLRKSVVSDGFAVTEKEETTHQRFFSQEDLQAQDQETGYIYVLRSLSPHPDIRSQKNLYKIGFSTTSVEERIAHAEQEPTYLMAPVQVVATYHIVNLHSQRFEELIHRVLQEARFYVEVTDGKGHIHQPQEWFVVPLHIIDAVIRKIMDESIVRYQYNPHLQCLEEVIREKEAVPATLAGKKTAKLSVRKEEMKAVMEGKPCTIVRELKQHTLNRYTYVDEADGQRYLRRFDAVLLVMSRQQKKEQVWMEVTHVSAVGGKIVFHLGKRLVS